MKKRASVPTGLFIDTPEMNDVSRHALGQEAAEWPEEIVQKVKERVPKAAGLNLMVKFMAQDEESGTATGAVIMGSTEKSAIIPLIIKDFKLYPMDVMIADRKMVPLTPDYFDAMFMNNDLFQKMEEYPAYGGMGRFDNYSQNITEAIYPPDSGRYSHAGTYKLLEEIANTINPEEWSKKLASDPVTIKRFIKKGHEMVIKAITKIQPVNMNEYKQTVRDMVPRSILQVGKDGRGGYNILTNNDVVFDPRMANYSNRDLATKAMTQLGAEPHDWLNDVDRNGEKTLYTKDETDSVYLYNGDEEVPVFAREFGRYTLKKKNGVCVDGFVIPRVITFDMKPSPYKIFLGDTNSTIQTEFAGVKHDRYEEKIKGDVPKAGQTGVFVYIMDRKALCTVPVTIETVVDSDYQFQMKARDFNGNPMYIQKCIQKGWRNDLGDDGSYDLVKIVNMNAKPDSGCCTVIGGSAETIEKIPRFQIPERFIWCPMEGFHEMTNSIADYMMKVAGEYKTSAPAKIIKTGYGFYSVQGLDKYASSAGWDKTNLYDNQVRFLLASLGCSEKVANQAMKVAHVKGWSEVHKLHRIPTFEEKKFSKVGQATSMHKICKLLRCDLTKEASYMENSQTVDTLLGLNFVSTDNIAKFVNYIPQFKGTISALCGCLLASRMGMQDIPEQPTSTAMYRLIDVVNGLERLRAVQEQGASK